MDGPDIRLAVYGTLAPGRSNAHVLADLHGRWIPGTVRGHLFDVEWASKLGYPAIELDPTAPEVACQIFESHDLPDHWERLDDFEGPGYERVTTLVATSEGNIEAWIYSWRKTRGAAAPTNESE